MAEKDCRFITNRGMSDSPSSAAGEIVYETLVLPVMAHFPEFATHLFEYDIEPGSIADDFMGTVLEADLVIADMTDLSYSGYFQLGVRHNSGRPMVLIADEALMLSSEPANFRIVRYPYETPAPSGEEKRATSELIEAIKDALADERRSSGLSLLKRQSPKQTRAQLASRLYEAAEAIRLLRLNSTSDAVLELENIAKDLEEVPEDKIAPALQETAIKFLKILSRLADQLATVRGARMLISGVISVVLGGAGFSAITAFGISLAFWEGKEAFLKAIEFLSKRKK